MFVSRKIKNRGLERKEKIKVTKKNKRIYFLYSEFTLTAILFWDPAVTFQDFRILLPSIYLFRHFA